jgi:hypothetical protein
MTTYPYPDTIQSLLADLHAGDNPRALRLMGEALGWKYRVLAKYAPNHAIKEMASRT